MAISDLKSRSQIPVLHYLQDARQDQHMASLYNSLICKVDTDLWGCLGDFFWIVKGIDYPAGWDFFKWSQNTARDNNVHPPLLPADSLQWKWPHSYNSGGLQWPASSRVLQNDGGSWCGLPQRHLGNNAEPVPEEYLEFNDKRKRLYTEDLRRWGHEQVVTGFEAA